MSQAHITQRDEEIGLILLITLQYEAGPHWYPRFW